MIKSTRNEQIVTTVNHYLKRRQYMDVGDIGQKRARHSICSVKEMAVSCAVLNNGSTGVAVSFSSLSGDATIYDQQYTRVRAFVSESSEPFHSELSALLYPIFVRIYLELVSGGQKVAAQRFFAKHHATFADVEEAKPLLTNLLTVTTKEELLANKSISEFWEHKYSISLSEKSLRYLLKFLKNEDNVMLLQIVSQNLDVTVRDDESALGESAADDQLDGPLNVASSETGVESTPSDVTMESLQRIIQKMHDGPPPLPSICLYSVINANQGLSSICLSPDEELMCAGFEDSRIQIWGLSPGSLPVPPPVFDVSHLRLGNDHPDDIEARVSVCRDAETTSDSVTLRSHSDSVYSLSFLRDHRYLLSASADKTVRLWDTDTCSNVVCYRGHNYPVVGVDSSSVGSYFASCSFDLTCKLWCSDRLFPLRNFIGHTRTVNCVKFHPNGNYLATGSSDMTVRLWSLQDGSCVRLMKEHRGPIMALAFSPNGKFLASSGEDHCVKIWDLSSGNVLGSLKGHSDTIYSLAFNQFNSLLASGGHDCMVNVWDVHKVGNCSDQSTDVTLPSEPLGLYPTKSVAIHYLNFSKKNFLQAAGC